MHPFDPLRPAIRLPVEHLQPHDLRQSREQLVAQIGVPPLDESVDQLVADLLGARLKPLGVARVEPVQHDLAEVLLERAVVVDRDQRGLVRCRRNTLGEFGAVP